jgi:hypothetical protein
MEGWDNTVAVRDPSKMTTADLHQLYIYWKERAKRDEVVLTFIQASQKDKRERFGMSKKEIREMKRRKEAWVDVGDDDEENEGYDDEESEGGDDDEENEGDDKEENEGDDEEESDDGMEVVIRKKDKGKGKMKTVPLDDESQSAEVQQLEKRKRVDADRPSSNKRGKYERRGDQEKPQTSLHQ